MCKPFSQTVNITYVLSVANYLLSKVEFHLPAYRRMGAFIPYPDQIRRFFYFIHRQGEQLLGWVTFIFPLVSEHKMKMGSHLKCQSFHDIHK